MVFESSSLNFIVFYKRKMLSCLHVQMELFMCVSMHVYVCVYVTTIFVAVVGRQGLMR